MPLRQLEQEGKTTQDDARRMRRFLDQFRQLPFLFGAEVVVPMLTGDQRTIAFHPLSRPYKGGFVTSQTAGGFGEAVAVHEPKSAVALGYITDPSTQVSIALNRALTADKTFYLWVW